MNEGEPGSDGDVLARFERLDPTAVSDALDMLDLPSGFSGLAPLWGSPKVVGYASTVQLEPSQAGASGVHINAHTVAEATGTTVIVIANAGRTDVSCWGGLLSLGATLNGARGVLADGVCRDLTEARDLGFPVFARGTCPRTARGRLQEASRGDRVTVAGVEVDQGDLVIADDTGAAVVPAGHLHAVLTRAEAIVAREHAIAADLRNGVPLPEAMLDARLAGTTTSTRQQTHP